MSAPSVTFAELEGNECPKLAQYVEIRLCWKTKSRGPRSGEWVANTRANRRQISATLETLLLEVRYNPAVATGLRFGLMAGDVAARMETTMQSNAPDDPSAVIDAIIARSGLRNRPKQRQAAKWLMQSFPNVFCADQSKIRPLKIGIYDEIVKIAEMKPSAPDPKSLRRAMMWWCTRPAYLRMLARGKWRRDLNGEKVARVPVEERKRAAERYRALYGRKQSASNTTAVALPPIAPDTEVT